MAATISKSKMFAVTTAVDDARLKTLRQTPELIAAAMRAGATYWHDRVLPGHFRMSAHAKYGYAKRAARYLKTLKKNGKPDLVYSGSLRRDLLAAAAYKEGAGGAVELRMTARVLNLCPDMPQNSADLYVKQSNGRSYPNTKREIKLITAEEREAVAKMVAGELAHRLGFSSPRLRVSA